MAYTVLARKYRSQTFDDVVGQDPISKTLKNAIETGRVAHAYLFSGTRGVGKTTMARILAKSLNCLKSDGPTTTPCCQCDSCVAINSGEDIDVIEIDGASNNRVDEIRELRENAIYRPARARYKIYIIDEVHMLTTQAFNALLKTLEEPPEHVKFIFATTEPNKVIATIQSRCQRFDFSNISAKQIADQLKSILKKEEIEYQDDLVLALAKMANGSMRDGLSLLDRLISTGIQPLSVNLLEDFLGRPNAEKIQTLVARIGDGDAAGTLMATEDLINTGLGEAQIVDALTEQMRDLLVIASAGVETDLLIMTADQKEKAAELAKKFDAAALIYNITALEKLRWAVKNSDTPRALLDASLLRFALSEHFMNVEELLSRSSGGAGVPVKKKLPIEPKPAPAILSVPSRSVEPRTTVVPVAQAEAPAENLTEPWPEVLGKIAKQLGPATTGLLTGSNLKGIAGNTLTIEFPPTGKTQKQMCESNGRGDQIAEVLGEYLGRAVRVKFTVAEPPVPDEEPERKPFAERQRQILNDPAVKTVLLELGATVTGIEEE
ncbi:MAG TPA: DNA polymerase III subunit gamma/tau [Sedimentisphaerales bacterium]|nr:DNA polymerase III subunit gamma/tau [Sedimentisphaerales bacterium]HRS12490.1 DNA polymerase III subunit gamma/tau [Sedimentisphaerales bacterium]HRV49128.1 DNA polymerase III subunit gamma/tau [Sedimentisphaerales bacterium]